MNKGILCWCDAVGGPCDKDMVKFTEYLLSLVTLHHTDLLQKVLLHLKYLVIRNTRSEWGKFYLKVKSAAKEAVENEYNMHIEL
ncbi:hypothetical protein EB796_003404 [Bugula neritina]|uniref:DNA repair protein Rev1 C-terminal domain-containing protein n=1 Tax=Bugula neritina TaxID=10212 RepID=A0A7J7KKU9_BUGNE|nr:hypothetical protein EB796_003404 [Bugula neritina]